MVDEEVVDFAGLHLEDVLSDEDKEHLTIHQRVNISRRFVQYTPTGIRKTMSHIYAEHGPRSLSVYLDVREKLNRAYLIFGAGVVSGFIGGTKLLTAVNQEPSISSDLGGIIGGALGLTAGAVFAFCGLRRVIEKKYLSNDGGIYRETKRIIRERKEK